ncbi:MAG: PQQ-binding-like beta-propeller repeat protein [Verrucomicrobiota bacterium]|nr:PQQ-binding-like beta-propeller repeat protein [Verrucomicrobiota bacterium]
MRIVALFLVLSFSLSAENWPGWRGPRGDGSSQEKNVPTRWSPTENIAWKQAIPGKGHSSPVIWENQIFLLACLAEKEERVLLCLDRRTGKTIWQSSILKTPLETLHRLNSRASSTPVTDGKMVYVTTMKVDERKISAPNVGAPRMITPGSFVVSAFDMEGKKKWERNVGEFISAHGFNACPVLYRNLVIVNGDHDGDAYLAALDKQTGELQWKVPRENKTRSYATPIIRTIKGKEQMILCGDKSVASYDPATGKRHWIIDGPTEQFVASMVYNGKYAFVTGGYPERHILAIRPEGSGNVTETHIAWRVKKGASYVPSPVVVGPYFVIVADNGIASCFKAEDGTRLWMERLGGGHSASTITADGLVYFVSDRGITSVLKPGPKFEEPKKNDLKELVSSSPAISQGQLFIRGHKHLYCIGKKPN